MSRKTLFDEKTRGAITKYSEATKEFYRKNIREGLSPLNSKKFEETRNMFIQKFSNEINRNDREKSLYLFLNLFQSACIIKEELLSEFNKFDQIDEKLIDQNLYYTLCLLIFKFEDQNFLPLLKETIIENNINFENIIQMEMLVLNKLNWNVYFDSPYDLTYLILSEISMKFDINEKESFEIFNSIIDLISYCFCELTIYSDYNQFEISITCMLLVFEVYLEQNLLVEFKTALIELINCDFTLSNIQDCKFIIEHNFKKEDNTSNYNIGQEFASNKGLITKQQMNEYNNSNKMNNKALINSVNNSNFSTLELDDENRETNYYLISEANDYVSSIEVNKDNGIDNSFMEEL